MFPLFTSLPPNSTFSPVVENWRRAGFFPISINNRNESEALSGQGIEIIAVDSQSPKLSLCDVLKVIRERSYPVAGLINGDCRFADFFTAASLSDVLSRSLILAERIDVDLGGTPVDALSSGFDAMFFDTSVIESLSPRPDFRLGAPWWDYWLPLAVRRRQFKVRHFDCPVLLHAHHKAHWDEPLHRHLAEIFAEDFEMVGQDLSKVAKDTFCELLDGDAVAVSGLTSDARKIVGQLHANILHARDLRVKLMNIEHRLRLVTSSRAYRMTAPVRWVSRWLRYRFPLVRE